MAIYLISYDLQDRSKEGALLAYLEHQNGAIKATQTSFLLSTSLTAEQIVTDIRRITRDKVDVYAFTVAPPYFGFGPNDANVWLARNLPQT